MARHRAAIEPVPVERLEVKPYSFGTGKILPQMGGATGGEPVQVAPVGGLRKMKDFDLSSREVQMKLEERYPNGVPLEETVISPQDVFQSDALATVYSQ